MDEQMKNELIRHGSFTLPGEAGYEDLTLQLAEKWGADVIRDCDGTVLSEKILSAGFEIYSTLCLIRGHNEWAKENLDKIQQNYLMSDPVMADGNAVTVNLLKGFFSQQFSVNNNDDPHEWWQVFDRTAGVEIPLSDWDYDPENTTVTIRNTQRWHRYTVNFLAYRIWELISMYNHITNNWGDREHLLPIDPRYPETQEYILNYLAKWLTEHPHTNVVRMTTMFYNGCWFWGEGSDEKIKIRYDDWSGYNGTVSPLALTEFEKAKGYKLLSEDFINFGRYNSTNNVPSKKYIDYIDFVSEFVVGFGKKCVELIHQAGKKAYMFYDDQWIGTEPHSQRFKELSFDGVIKCLYDGFAVRQCMAVQGANIKELRLHPYLFPVGFEGEPVFADGGTPGRECRKYWINIRRALLRQCVNRIGLGGYLHLVSGYPDFVEAVEQIGDEFRLIKAISQQSPSRKAEFKIAILTSWGKLRSWVCGFDKELKAVLESLSGLPFDVEFLSFSDVLEAGIPEDVKVLINCGRAGSSWNGGDHWKNERIIETLSQWVALGGGFIGIGEPSAVDYRGQFFQLSSFLGVDREIGLSLSNGKERYSLTEGHFITEDVEGDVDFGDGTKDVFILDKNIKVLSDNNGSPQVATNIFHRGRAVYFSGFKYAAENTRLLHRALYWLAGLETKYKIWTCSNINTECAYYPKSNRVVVINNSEARQDTLIYDFEQKEMNISLEPSGIKIITLSG